MTATVLYNSFSRLHVLYVLRAFSSRKLVMSTLVVSRFISCLQLLEIHPFNLPSFAYDFVILLLCKLQVKEINYLSIYLSTFFE